MGEDDRTLADMMTTEDFYEQLHAHSFTRSKTRNFIHRIRDFLWGLIGR